MSASDLLFKLLDVGEPRINTRSDLADFLDGDPHALKQPGNFLLSVGTLLRDFVETHDEVVEVCPRRALVGSCDRDTV